MKTPITTGTFVALVVSAVLGYAAPQHPQRSQTETPRSPSTGAPPGATSAGVGSTRNNREQLTTLTGCLRQGSSPRSYVLVQSPGSSVPDGGVGAAGARDPEGIRYDLVLDSKTDASKMVGRQVQVMGTDVITPSHPQTRGFAVGGLTRFTVKTIKQTGSGC